jgi:hypothetical protein
MGTYILQPITTGPAPLPLDGVSVAGNSIRAVQNSNPVTTTWNVGDIWIDTLTTANTTRVWTGTAFSPARSTSVPLFQDLFTGTDGVVWNTSNWVTALTPTTGTGYGAVYSGNMGKISSSNTGGGANTSRIGRSVNITNPTDCNISMTFKFDSTGASPIIWARANSALNGSAGYSLTIQKGLFYMNKWVSFSATDFNPGGTTYSYADGNSYSMRLRCVGTTIQSRIWNAADAEPATWQVSVTDSTITTAGYIGVSVAAGMATVPANFYIDTFTVDPS